METVRNCAIVWGLPNYVGQALDDFCWNWIKIGRVMVFRGRAKLHDDHLPYWLGLKIESGQGEYHFFCLSIFESSTRLVLKFPSESSFKFSSFLHTLFGTPSWKMLFYLVKLPKGSLQIQFLAMIFSEPGDAVDVYYYLYRPSNCPPDDVMCQNLTVGYKYYHKIFKVSKVVK